MVGKLGALPEVELLGEGKLLAELLEDELLDDELLDDELLDDELLDDELLDDELLCELDDEGVLGMLCELEADCDDWQAVNSASTPRVNS